jgi:hypothetical protein
MPDCSISAEPLIDCVWPVERAFCLEGVVQKGPVLGGTPESWKGVDAASATGMTSREHRLRHFVGPCPVIYTDVYYVVSSTWHFSCAHFWGTDDGHINSGSVDGRGLWRLSHPLSSKRADKPLQHDRFNKFNKVFDHPEWRC